MSGVNCNGVDISCLEQPFTSVEQTSKLSSCFTVTITVNFWVECFHVELKYHFCSKFFDV